MKLIERKGFRGLQTTYYFEESKIKLILIKNSSFKEIVVSWLKDVFLPQGYPYSVSSDYLQYQIWDSCQAYCSNLAGALSLHSTFIGIGVGKEAASPLAAALSWLLQDGSGMVSSITFAYWKGSDLDNNSKQWRLFADVANDGAHLVKLLAPYLPVPFVCTLCFASVITSLVGVAGGCTRASLIQHQALRNNMADVSAKDGSQETLVNLAGLITSLTFLPFLTSTPFITWLTFIICVFLHLFSNYQAMRTIQMKTANRARFLHILHHWINYKKIPDILTTNQAEPMLMGPAFQSDYFVSSYRLEMGVSLDYVFKNASAEELIEFQHYHQYQNLLEDNYMLFVSETRKKIFIVYNCDVDSKDVLRSFFAAYICAINNYSAKGKKFHREFIYSGKSMSYQKFSNFIMQETRNSFQGFLSKFMEAGWVIDPLRLNIGEWRVKATHAEKKKEK